MRRAASRRQCLLPRRADASLEKSSSVTAIPSPECVQILKCDHLLVTGPQSAQTWGVCSHINQNHQAGTFKTMKVMGIQQLLIHSCFKFGAIDDLQTAAYQLLCAAFLHPRPHPHWQLWEYYPPVPTGLPL